MNYNDFSSKYVLGREEVYQASPRIWSFQFANDIVNGINLRLSNMAGGFPFEFNRHRFTSSECLYLCGEWSYDTDEHRSIQEELMRQVSGFACKRFIKSKYRKQVREDFHTFRLQWMLFCVWQKCKGNADFRKLLLSIPHDAVLVENTTKDKWESAEIWGCRNRELVAYRENLKTEIRKANPTTKQKELEQYINIETNKINSIGMWRGQNNIGKILMICQDCIINGTEPAIDFDLLRDARIYILGELLQFD